MELKKIGINFLYLTNLILYILALKALNYYFFIDNIFFSCLMFGLFFPFLFIIFLYKKLILTKIELISGFIDYVQLILLYISINKLNIGEYLSYRTFSLFFNMILSYVFLNKSINKTTLLGNFIIFASCISLLIIGGINNILFAICTIVSSFMYSLLGFLMEKYKEENNYISTKMISCFFHLMTYFIYNLCDSTSVITNSSNLIWVLMIFISFSEVFYYWTKYLIIKITDNGSVFTNILDIIRRAITLIIGIIIFKDTYQPYLFICFGFILLGCILINFSDKINEIVINIYNKITKKNFQELPA
jgi:drug/metabolite transporter (DMT)-like permease